MSGSAGAAPRQTSRGPFRRATVLAVLGVQVVVLVRAGPGLLTWVVTRILVQPHRDRRAVERPTGDGPGQTNSGRGARHEH